MFFAIAMGVRGCVGEGKGLATRETGEGGLVPVVHACVKFYWNPGKIVFFGIF